MLQCCRQLPVVSRLVSPAHQRQIVSTASLQVMLMAPQPEQPRIVAGLTLEVLQEMVPQLPLSTVMAVVDEWGTSEQALEVLLGTEDPSNKAPPAPDISPHLTHALPASVPPAALHPSTGWQPAAGVSSLDSMMRMLLPHETGGNAAVAEGLGLGTSGGAASSSPGDWAWTGCDAQLHAGEWQHNGSHPTTAGWACNPPAAGPKCRQWWTRWGEAGPVPPPKFQQAAPQANRASSQGALPTQVQPCAPQSNLQSDPFRIGRRPSQGYGSPSKRAKEQAPSADCWEQIVGACTAEPRPAPAASRAREVTPAAPSTTNSTYNSSYDTPGTCLMWVSLRLVPVMAGFVLPCLR